MVVSMKNTVRGDMRVRDTVSGYRILMLTFLGSREYQIGEYDSLNTEVGE